MSNKTLTRVPGIRVGHAEVEGGGSGSTVVLGPFRAAVHVSGMATGSRELDPLDPEHLVPQVDAIVLTGGSAFGLAAADGVMQVLADHGQGFTVVDQIVPIVPTAVLFDLEDGRARPDASTGRAACLAATAAPVPSGRVGAGAGATVGKVGGRKRATPAGTASVATQIGPFAVGALTVVNAFGDVLDEWGSVLAGARGPDGVFLNTGRVLKEGLERGQLEPVAVGQNTTLSVVATDAPLSRVDLTRMARLAATALPRRISPVNTLFDGDVTFAVSTAPLTQELRAAEVTALGTAARDCLERAIEASVRSHSPRSPR